MHDPFPIQPPERLVSLIEPLASSLALKTLPYHFHEVFLAFLLYHCTHKYIAPAFSRLFFQKSYASFNSRTRMNWNVHIVSFVQSTLICGLALYVMWNDDERRDMGWMEKVHGYTGAGGLIQAFAGGYFVWDLAITLQNINIFGLGMLAHAVSALFVFSLGFRPFVNFYAPTFILYELSSPFLNIHWFCDKLNMTGSKVQLYNGILLLSTFFGCRLVWGTYQSIRVFSDVYRTISAGNVALDAELGELKGAVQAGNVGTMQFAGDGAVPLWLAGCYLASNLTLNGLNWFWFGKMIETIRKRFDPPLGTRKVEEKEPEKEQVLVEGIDVDTPPPSDPVTPFAISNDTDYISAVTLEKAGHRLEVEQLDVRRRTGGNPDRPISSAPAA